MTGEGGGAHTPPGEASLRPLVISGLVLAALVIAFAAWVWAADQQRQGVAVSMSQPPRCAGTEVVWRRLAVGHPVPTIRVRESMDCQVRLRVVNRGRWTVHLREVVLPLMGPHGGGAFRVEQLDGMLPATDRTTGGTDAAFPVNRELVPGTRLVFPVHFTFRPNGCTGAGSTTWLERMPQVTVSALGRPGTVSGRQVIAFAGTADGDCR